MKSRGSIDHLKHVTAEWSAQRPGDKLLYYPSGHSGG